MTTILSVAAFCFIAPAVIAEPWHLGLPPPSNEPQLFRPAVLASLAPLTIVNPSFSPDYRRLIVTVADTSVKDRPTIELYETRHDGSGWSQPLRVLHAAGSNTNEAIFARDGRSVLFVSNRPPGEPPWKLHVFRARVTGDGFKDVTPVSIESPHGGGLFYPVVLADESLSFTSRSSRGDDDLFVAAPRGDGGYQSPRALGGDFNTNRHEWDLVENPQGTLRFWASERTGGVGRTDIYLSRRDPGGEWSQAVNVSAINTQGWETAPKLTPDGEVLLFQRRVDGAEQLFWIRVDALLEPAARPTDTREQSRDPS